MAKQYTLQTRAIQAAPRSKRLRELGGNVFNVSGGGSSIDYDLSVLRYIKVVNGKMLVTLPLGSTGDIFAKGEEGSGGGSGTGTPGYDRLDRWADYTAVRAGDVLSALLGYDLHTRVQSIESGKLEMTWDNISGKPLTFTPSAHNHPISQINGLDSALADKAPLSHVGDVSHLTAGQRAVLDSFSVINGKVVANKPLGSISDVFAKSADGGAGGGTPSYNRLDAWADYASAKAGYVLSALLGYDLHTRVRAIETGQIPLTWDNITGKPVTFTPSAHNHTIAQVNGLQEALEGKVGVVAGKGLSTNDYTTAEKTKLAGLSNYIHPSFTARTISAAAGLVLSAISINANGHVSSIESKVLAAADIPTLAISHVSGLQTSLDNRAPLSHVGDISHLTAGQRDILNSFSIINGKLVANKPLGSTGDVFAKGVGGDGGGSIFNRLDSWADYTAAKAGYALSALLGYDLHTRLQTIETGQVSLIWDNITGKPATFTPSAHIHTIAQVNGLQSALDGKQVAGSYAAAAHSHTIANITGLQGALDGKQAAGNYALLSSLNDYIPNTNAVYTNSFPYGLKTGFYRTGGGSGSGEYGYSTLIVSNFENKGGGGALSIDYDSRGLRFTGFGEGKTTNWKEVWHSGNFNPGSYLPLSGGVIANGSDVSPLVINSTGAQTFISIFNSGAYKGALGWINTHGLFMYNSNSGRYLGITDSGIPYFQGNILWHSGNLNRSDTDFTANSISNGHDNYKLYVRGVGSPIYGTQLYLPYDAGSTKRTFRIQSNWNSGNHILDFGISGHQNYVSDPTEDTYTRLMSLSTSGDLTVAGNIKAGGEVSNKSSSDEAFKTDPVTIMKGSDILKRLRPVEFTWNNLIRKYNPDKVGKSASFIAQEFAKVLPWAVSQIYEKYLAIDKEAVIPYLVSGWQEHESELNALKRRVLTLENEIKQLKSA